MPDFLFEFAENRINKGFADFSECVFIHNILL